MPDHQAISAIEALAGMEELKDFCARLVQAAENLKGLRLEQIPLPNLVFATVPGVGTTMHLRLLCDLLKELKLFRFQGEESCFEWILSDEREGLQRLIVRTSRASGFYGQFRGVIGLDISPMIEKADSAPRFSRLLEFVESQQGRILFVFIIPLNTDPALVKQLLGQFASYTPVEIIHMPFPSDETQYYVTDELFSRGFEVSPGAQQMLKTAVLRLMESPNFEGYQTLQNLTNVIIWKKISRFQPIDEKITELDLQFIFAEEGFCSTLNAYSS